MIQTPFSLHGPRVIAVRDSYPEDWQPPTEPGRHCRL